METTHGDGEEEGSESKGALQTITDEVFYCFYILKILQIRARSHVAFFDVFFGIFRHLVRITAIENNRSQIHLKRKSNAKAMCE